MSNTAQTMKKKKILEISLLSLRNKSTFKTYVLECNETPKTFWRKSNSSRRRVLKKQSLLNPRITSSINSLSGFVLEVHCLPKDEAKAKRALLDRAKCIVEALQESAKDLEDGLNEIEL